MERSVERDGSGMGWNGMECGMESNGMEWNGMEWNGMEWNEKEWNGMEWYGMEWNGAEWNGMERGAHLVARRVERQVDLRERGIGGDGWGAAAPQHAVSR